MSLNNYVVSHGFTQKYLNDLKAISCESAFHIYGATGALGKSVLLLIDEQIIKPKSIILYLRETSDSTDWLTICKKYNIPIIVEKLNSINYLKKEKNKAVVLYFLGSAQPSIFLKDPESLFKINVSMLIDVVKCAPKYLFYASSSELYSGISKSCSEETTLISSPTHPRGPYIESKRCGEAILNSMTSGETRAVSFRIALATPPYHFPKDKRVLSELIAKGVAGLPIQLQGGHNSVRQYQWGPFATLKILQAGFFGKENLYNISGGEKLTLEEIAKAISVYFGVNYIDNNQLGNHVQGAPDCVDISMKKFESEFPGCWELERFVDLLNTYHKLR